jgi:hypothetical protein
MPVILATQEAEIRRTVVQSLPGKQFTRSYLRKNLDMGKKSVCVWGGLVRWYRP